MSHQISRTLTKYTSWCKQWCNQEVLDISSDLQFLTRNLVTVPSAPSTISITVTFIYCFFTCLWDLCTSLSVAQWHRKIHLWFSFCQFTDTVSGSLTEIGGYAYIWKSHGILLIWFFRIGSTLCIYHLSKRSNFNLLHNSSWVTLLLLLLLLVKVELLLVVVYVIIFPDSIWWKALTKI